jgi:hypothetical protein
MPLLNRQMLDVMGIKDAEKLVPMEEDMRPVDPVTENQNIIMMKPVKAFINQDHQAHIIVHMSAMQDPKLQQLMQNNPQAQQLQSSMMAHIAEHVAFAYRRQIEEQLGMPLPPEKDESGDTNYMDPQIEARLSPLLAQAAQRLLAKNSQEVSQQAAQQQAQDPLVQMQQQELQIKMQEAQRKAQKDQMDAQLKSEQLQIERERIQSQAETEDKRTRVDAMKSVAKMRNDRASEMEQLSIDVLKHLSDKHHSDQDRLQRERFQNRGE